MKNFLNILLVFAAAMETNRTLAQSWTTLGGNYLKTDASTDGVVVGNIAASPSPTIGLLVDGTSLNTTTGEVFRTDAPNGGDTWWRLYRGGTEYGTLFNEAANTHFTQNAPEGHQLWQTNGLHRMQLNQTQYSTIGDFTVPTDGFLGVGLNFSFTFVGGPWTRMHLMDRSWQPQVTELYRDWMRNGLTMTSEYDQMYVGQMADDSDYNAPVHAVFQWGAFHDVEVDPTLARFIYAGEHTATPSGENSGFGKEIMQLHPLGFAGIGDWNAASVTASAIVSPTERLDLLDGRLRIRDLPLDPEGDYLDKYLVVDDVNPATGEFGVVKWRHLPAASIACDWTSAPATFRLHTASAAISAAPCPDLRWTVGVGLTQPTYKLDVKHTETDATMPGGLRVDFKGQGTSWRTGLVSTIQPVNTTTDMVLGKAVDATIFNVGLAAGGTTAQSYALFGRSHTTAAVTLQQSYGAYGEAYASAGTLPLMYGTYGSVRVQSSAVATSGYGALGTCSPSSGER
ncbi:MAG TPA: hypothetical protein PLB89_16335 [Flavobacteriales bacterium]|nr:hypothetical protein [Flavobacteriales bacterium]